MKKKINFIYQFVSILGLLTLVSCNVFETIGIELAFRAADSQLHLDNTPEGVSEIENINIKVTSDPPFKFYKYKIGSTSSTDCESEESYSSPVSFKININHDLSSIPDGDVTLCVIGLDQVGERISKSATWIKSTLPPNALVSGMQGDTIYSAGDSLNLFVSSLIPTSIASYRYKILQSTGDCSDPIGYSNPVSSSVPITDNISSFSSALPGANTRLCVVAINSGGHQQEFANATTLTWTTDYTPPVSVLSGVPDELSFQDALAVVVSSASSDYSTYRFKLGYKSTTDCSLETGYSTSINKSLPISGDLSTSDDGTLLILCVVAVDDKGNQQVLSSATKHEWTLKRGAYSASLYNSCSVDRKGQLRCAGYNVYGNLGNNSTTSSYVTAATLIDEVNTYQTVATSFYHSCAIQRDGLMRCWGWNHYGALGDGSQYNIIYQPTLVSGPEKFSQVAVSYYTTCGLTVAGQLFCWGGNLSSFGDGTSNQSLIPKKVQSDKRYIKISARAWGFCGITDLNELFCWGYNNNNQLGFPTGTPSPSGVPIRIDGNEKYKEIAVGTYHSCGITITNELKCWGANNYSQIGTGAATPTIHPNPTLVGTNFIKVSPGNIHTCGIKDTGEARCWGANFNYQSSSSLGTGNVTTHAVVDSGTTYSDIYTENDMSCGITRRGEIRCWGRQSYGMFGIGSSINESWSTHKDPFSFTADYLTNSPTEPLHSDSFDLNLSINALNKVRGIEPTHFSYKMTSNCSDTTPYSEKYTLNTPIHFDLSSVQDGLIQICLLTFNEFGNGSQVPKIITFTKATKASLTISNQVTSSDSYSFGTVESYGTTNFLYVKNIGAVNASQISSYLDVGSSGLFQSNNSGSPEHPICTTDLPINETCAIGIRFEPSSYNWPYPNTDTAILTLNYYSDTEPKSLAINLSGVIRIPGCTNSSYQNYNQYANYDDGSCYSWDSSTMDTTTMDTTTNWYDTTTDTTTYWYDTTTDTTTYWYDTTTDTTTSYWWETTTNPEETTTYPYDSTTY